LGVAPDAGPRDLAELDAALDPSVGEPEPSALEPVVNEEGFRALATEITHLIDDVGTGFVRGKALKRFGAESPAFKQVLKMCEMPDHTRDSMIFGWSGTIRKWLPSAAEYSPEGALLLSTLAYCATIRTVLRELDPPVAKKPEPQVITPTPTPAP